MTTTKGAPSAEPTSLEQAGAFVRAAGLVVEQASGSRVTGHIDLDADHHTPWGVIHGGVYATAIESAASIGASAAVRDLGQVAVGITNTTHFLRSLSAGRVDLIALPLNQGRSQQLWRVDITDSSGRLIAHGEVRLQNITGQAPDSSDNGSE
jgi:1,4-dihydroxy-2-naphthoyl-CoA hydrolase